MKLRWYQEQAIEKLREKIRAGLKRVVMVAATGCHAKGTPILMADGSMKPVEMVEVGDRLIGDDGSFRTVTELHRGKEQMVQIIPVKGEPFVVNRNHVLSLVHTQTGVVTDVTVNQYIYWSKNKKHLHKLFRAKVDYFDVEQKKLLIHPWLLGALIGDGCLTKAVEISNPEKAIQDRVIQLATDVSGKVKNYGNCDKIALTNARGKGNLLLVKLRELGIHGKDAYGKFIPEQYKIASAEDRYHLLAGLLDTDGHLSHGMYDWITASERLADDFCFVARSLGFAAYKKACQKYCQNGAGGTYYRVSLSGDFSQIPTVKHPPFQRLQKKNVLRTGFSIRYLGEDDYYGFEVDGNHRYLMGDFTVTHNSGKTRIAGEIIMNAAKNGKRIAFVCNRIELVKQSVAAFEKLGIKCGIMQGMNTWEANSQVVVCSVQTMVRRKFNMFDIMIHDECHVTSASKAYHSVIESHSNVIHIGLTATPWSKGMSAPKKWLGGEPLWQDVVVAASIPMLIEQGFLVDCDIYAPGEPDLTGVKVVNGDYDKTQLGVAVDKAKLVGDIVSHWFKLASGEQTVVFAVNVAHSRHIVEEFVANGVDARHVDGYMSQEERTPIIEAFRRGEFQILSNCSMLAEGFDVPATSCCILARPTKSLIRYIQMVGRVLRPHEDKHRALILDHSGVVRRLGWPTEELPYELDDGKPKEKKERENLPKVCPSCFAVYKPSLKKCPVCQFEPKPVVKGHEVESGELVQLSRKDSKFTMEDKQAIYSAFLGWVKDKGMKEGAAYHKFKSMVGHYPSNKLDKTPGPMIDTVRNWITHENIKWAKSQPGIFRKTA